MASLGALAPRSKSQIRIDGLTNEAVPSRCSGNSQILAETESRADSPRYDHRGGRCWILSVFCLVFLLPTLHSNSLAQSCLVDEIRPVGVGGAARYGFAVTRSENLLVVGAPGSGAIAPGAGAVYVFTKSGSEWVSSSILFADDLAAGDQSGSALAIEGTTLVVGLRGDDLLGVDSGSVRVFEFSGFSWDEVATLSDPDGGAFDEFGASIAISGDVIVVGSPFDIDLAGNEVGSASVFRRVAGAWTHEAKLFSSIGDQGDSFGTAVAISGDRIAVGAPESNQAFLDAGSVVLFENLGGDWRESHQLTSSAAVGGELLGTSLAMTSNLILAGAPFSSSIQPDAGAVIPFRRDGNAWEEASAIVSPTPGPNQFFGSSLDLEGSEAVIGEPFASIGGAFAAGAAHRFFDDGSVFSTLDTVTSALPVVGSLLGGSVSIYDGEIITGAFLDNTFGFGSGTVHRFVVGGTDCDLDGTPDLCQFATGALTDCDGNNIPDECELLSGGATDCDGNGVIDLCDLLAGAEDCDLNGEIDSCEIALEDCNGNDLLDACESDCNANGAPDDCDITSGSVPDCNSNGNPDDCDIFFGLSTDCDGNFIPDECDLMSGVAGDCNGNGLSDACDLLTGTSEDLDMNGVPDECGTRFIRADLNEDLMVNLADGILLLQYVSGIGMELECRLLADANNDDHIDVADGVFVISFSIGAGPPPSAPFPDCGFDPRVEVLDCQIPPVCP